jgi:hypothetical protein
MAAAAGVAVVAAVVVDAVTRSPPAAMEKLPCQQLNQYARLKLANLAVIVLLAETAVIEVATAIVAVAAAKAATIVAVMNRFASALPRAAHRAMQRMSLPTSPPAPNLSFFPANHSPSIVAARNLRQLPAPRSRIQHLHLC